MIRRSQPSLLQMTPESKNASAVKCVTLTTSYGNPNAKTLYYMATLQTFPKTRRCTLPFFKPATAASPKRAPMTNFGASALARATPRAQTPRQLSAPPWPRPLAKRLRTYCPARQHCDILTKDVIRLALGHIGERRLAEACPHDKLWCTSLSACNLRASSPDTWL